MPLHRLTSVTIGVPNVAETAAYYTDFGLSPQQDGWFGTRDGGRQLRIVHSPTRRLVEVHVGADDSDDLARVADALHRLGIKSARGPHSVTAIEKATGVQATVEVSPRVTQAPARAVVYNGPGRIERTGARAPGVLRTERVQPRKLGHTVLGTTDLAITRAFILEGLGFKLSDAIKDVGTFMRCSTDHHNVLVLQAPVAFLHHTSWQVDDVDEVGRGASAMLTDHPERHIWGLGRTMPGRTSSGTSRTPPATLASTTPTWTASSTTTCGRPRPMTAPRACSTGVRHQPPPSFLAPDDLAALMTGLHSKV